MPDDPGDGGVTSGADDSPGPLHKVEDPGGQGEPPALVADTMGPEIITGEGGEGLWRISHEAAGGMSVEGEEEDESQVVGVPESLEALVANLVVRGGVHQQHAEEHDVASDTTGFGVMDVEST